MVSEETLAHLRKDNKEMMVKLAKLVPLDHQDSQVCFVLSSFIKYAL